jgi:hypothetical protein
MKLKKNELPEGWKLFRAFKDGAEYRGLRGFVAVRKDGKDYWFDWGIKKGDMMASSFVEDKKKIKPELKRIMTKEFVLEVD